MRRAWSSAQTVGDPRVLSWFLLAGVIISSPLYHIPGVASSVTTLVQATFFFAFLFVGGALLLGTRHVAIAAGGTSLALGALLAAVAGTLFLTNASLQGAGLFLRTYVLPVAFFALAFNVIRTKRDMLRVARLLVVSPAVMAVYAILARIVPSTGSLMLSALLKYSSEESGLSLSRGAYAVTLTVAVPLLVAGLARSYRRGTQTWIAFIPIVGLTGLALYLTWVRSAIVASALAIMLILWTLSRKTTVVVAVLLFSLGLLLSPKIAVWMRATSSVDVLTSGRSYLVPVAAAIIEEHPIIGVGVGNFSSHAVTLLPLGGMKYGTTNPHDLPLYVASESGVLAGIACLLFILGACAIAIRVALESRDPLASAFAAIVLTGALLSFVGAGVIFGNLFLNLPWWVSLAVLLRVSQGRWHGVAAREGSEDRSCH